MQAKSVHQTFTAALESLIEQVKQDRAILAAVLCGSMSHDTVWARSDIDLLLVTIDDRKTELSDMALNAEGVNVHALPVMTYSGALEPGETSAVRKWAANRISANRRRIGQQFLLPFLSRQRPPAVHARSDHRRSLCRPAHDW